eukprot:scaffold19479_cov111-Isochrysis_galbana.AAC.1
MTSTETRKAGGREDVVYVSMGAERETTQDIGKSEGPPDPTNIKYRVWCTYILDIVGTFVTCCYEAAGCRPALGLGGTWRAGGGLTVIDVEGSGVDVASMTGTHASGCCLGSLDPAYTGI